MKNNFLLTLSRIISVLAILLAIVSLVQMLQSGFRNINILELIMDIIIISNTYLMLKINNKSIKNNDRICRYIDLIDNMIQKSKIEEAKEYIEIAKHEEIYKEYEYYNK